MSARSQVTLCAQGGGAGEAVTVDQSGSPERLDGIYLLVHVGQKRICCYLDKKGVTNVIEVTSQPRVTADLHILDPKNPPPPQTIIRFAADMLHWMVEGDLEANMSCRQLFISRPRSIDHLTALAPAARANLNSAISISFDFSRSVCRYEHNSNNNNNCEKRIQPWHHLTPRSA
jgi:hypothetical protein